MDDDLANSRHVVGSDIRFRATFERQPQDLVDYTDATITLRVRFADNSNLALTTPSALLKTTNTPDKQVVEGKITGAQTTNKVGVLRYSWEISTVGGITVYEQQQLVLISQF